MIDPDDIARMRADARQLRGRLLDALRASRPTTIAEHRRLRALQEAYAGVEVIMGQLAFAAGDAPQPTLVEMWLA